MRRPRVRGAAAIAGAVAFTSARVLVPVARRAPARSLVRLNVNGRPVPATLGLAVDAGMLAGLVAAAFPGLGASANPSAAAVLVAVTGSAGWFDDSRGDERERGFRGHLRALRDGRVTGGAVKLAAGAAGGVAAGRALAREDALSVGAATALAANLVNLLDRAPGRAAKVSLLWGGGLLLGGAAPVRPAVAALVGSLLACVGADLREEAMLGDAGANPLGAVLGLATALSLRSSRGRLLLLTGLALANAASERWSFSRAIESVGWLRALDLLGRQPPDRNPLPAC